jgi:plastocyanin
LRLRWLALLAAFAAMAAGCASGPAVAGLAPPTTTSTTEAAPAGVFVVIIKNGAFRPSIVEIDTAVYPIVEWRHEDQARFEYVVKSDTGVFESPTLEQGDTFQVDFSALPPGIYRYNTELGRNRIPGSIDTRPKQ